MVWVQRGGEPQWTLYLAEREPKPQPSTSQAQGSSAPDTGRLAGGDWPMRRPLGA